MTPGFALDACLRVGSLEERPYHLRVAAAVLRATSWSWCPSGRGGGKKTMTPEESMELEEKVDLLAPKAPASTYNDDDDLVSEKIRVRRSVAMCGQV